MRFDGNANAAEQSATCSLDDGDMRFDRKLLKAKDSDSNALIYALKQNRVVTFPLMRPFKKDDYQCGADYLKTLVSINKQLAIHTTQSAKKRV